MKSERIAVAALLFLFGVLAALPARAQVTTGQTVTATAKVPKQKIDKFKGEVIRMNTVSIIVRDPKNSYLVRTFTFSPALAKKLQSLIDRGGYQPGDMVTVRYGHGTSVAQSISGKPSKAY